MHNARHAIILMGGAMVCMMLPAMADIRCICPSDEPPSTWSDTPPETDWLQGCQHEPKTHHERYIQTNCINDNKKYCRITCQKKNIVTQLKKNQAKEPEAPRSTMGDPSVLDAPRAPSAPQELEAPASPIPAHGALMEFY